MVAIVIGLLGVAASFSAQALARSKEFGMLRHIGVTRRQILAMLAVEGGLVTVLGIVLGFALGGCISLILVFIVNPQSFHWTMQLSLPWRGLLAVAFVLTASAALTALAIGPPCGIGQCNTRSKGGLVMEILKCSAAHIGSSRKRQCRLFGIARSRCGY